MDEHIPQNIRAEIPAESPAEPQNWHVDADGCCSQSLYQDATPETLFTPYRLYRLLTDLEDILRQESDDAVRLAQISPLVRHFLTHSPWIELQAQPPHPKTGWSVSTLYDEFDYPLTVQLVSWRPGMTSSIHNHAAWGLVAILSGEERNTFWQRSQLPPDSTVGPLEKTGERTLQAGEIITFMPEAIHQIKALGEEPVVSFNLYGETQSEKRFKFDAQTGAATRF